MTDKEFEKEIDKMYDKWDKDQAKMEELGLINYGDSGYYWRNPEEYEKDKKICQLESKIERLEYLLKVSDKALELACENMYENEFVYMEQGRKVIKELIVLFKNKAKEKMKSE